MKIDLKDKRILEQLDKDSTIRVSSLAKKVGLSRQVCEYRINKLLEQGTIHRFYTVIDVSKLGYSYYRARLRLKNITEESYKKLGKQIFTEHPTFWVAFVSGSFDLIAGIFAKSSEEFVNIISEILKKNKDSIQSYESLQVLEGSLYSYGYFLKEKKERTKQTVFKVMQSADIDEIDNKILKSIKTNSRKTTQHIANETGVSRKTVKNRIKNLEKKGVIAGYKAFMNFHHFNKQSFKIFIKYDNTNIEQEKDLLNYLETYPGILATVKYLGHWNLDIEIHKEDIKELQKFIIDIRNRFQIIDDYEIMHIIDDYGFDFYPDEL